MPPLPSPPPPPPLPLPLRPLQMAESSNLIKTLLIKAEDARILGDMKSMRKYYRQLYDLNKDLVTEHDKRATNHGELLKNLKEVNMMIQVRS